MNKIEINNKKSKKIIICLIVIISMLLLAITGFNILITKQAKESVVTVYEDSDSEKSEIEWFKQDEDNEVDIDNIINQNLTEKEKEEVETQKETWEYQTQYQNNNKLPKGMVKVLQQGQDGEQEIIIRKKYIGEKLVSDEQIGRKITTPSIDKIVEVGTGTGYDNYTIKIGDYVYSTPYTLAIRKSAKKDAEVIISIDQDSKLKVEKKLKSWYYVRFESYYGWVEEDCVTHIEPYKTINNKVSKNYSKSYITSRVSPNMNLMAPSGLSLEQFKKVLSNNKQDKNKVFENNAKYFYYAEKQYGINGIFVAAIGIHESAWGTSKISKDKKNLFGYGAYDKSAYSSAYSYKEYAASIDMIARVLVKYYLNPKGTSIYNGEVATGQYYNGRTLSAVNKKYATDKKWNSGVYKWMQYLYNRL